MEEKKIIEFRNIVKSFDGQVILKGINLDIYENEFVTLLGPSGCGKTTLLRILGGFLQADEGDVIFDGEEINQKPPYERELISKVCPVSPFKRIRKHCFWLKNQKNEQGYY